MAMMPRVGRIGGDGESRSELRQEPRRNCEARTGLPILPIPSRTPSLNAHRLPSGATPFCSTGKVLPRGETSGLELRIRRREALPPDLRTGRHPTTRSSTLGERPCESVKSRPPTHVAPAPTPVAFFVQCTIFILAA